MKIFKKDSCVLCGKKTKEDASKDIRKRKYYVEGAGQLCEKCYKKIFRKETMIKLRPHHLLCLLFYEGKGYNEEFISNMNNVIEILNRDDQFELVQKMDDLCKRCPNNINGKCISEEKVLRYDDMVFSYLNKTSNWTEMKKDIILKIIKTNEINSICSNCQWYSICSLKVHNFD